MDIATAEPHVVARLSELLGAPAQVVAHERAVDLLLHVGSRVVAVEFLAQAGAAHIGQALARLAAARRDVGQDALLVVAVPYMGPVGQRLCAAAQVNWLDLSGNAQLVAPDLRILIEGQPNRYKTAGRRPDLFSPMRARVARRLLMEPNRTWLQAELLAATGLDAGHLSRTLRDLVSAGLVHRDAQRHLSVPDPDLLLTTWREAYDFDQHQRLAGHLAVRSGDELVERITGHLRERGLPFAVTGLPAAWCWAPMAMYRLVTVYVADLAAFEAAPPGGFRAEPGGANLWLVRPSDRGVFDGAEEVAGCPCVHPVQVYLDLKAQPERAAEAADELRRARLSWSRHA
jgi:hypothetical protein